MKKIKSPHDLSNRQIVQDGCMIVYSGTLINLFEPDPESISAIDIAHGLAFTCRWNGATKTYYSVAEHCCMMYDQAPDHLKPIALLHDAEEAYFGDIIKPLKNMLPQDIIDVMERFKQVVFERFGITEPEEAIKELDFKMLTWDFNNIIMNRNHVGLSCYEAEVEWIKRFTELVNMKLINPCY